MTATLMLAGLLSGPANAQLAHRYDFDSVNDTVGTANGTLVGTASISGGALVTDGGNGTVNGTWSGTGPRMTVDPAAVSGITGAFTIETWFTCTTGWPKYDSLYAFSDGSTANYLLGVPVRGYSPYPSGVAIKGAGGNTADQPVLGIYLDTGLHQTMLTYDGTTFTYYIDGAIANFSGLSATLSDPGFNLSTLTDIGVNGGSPWGDPTLTGSTFDFRIYKQSLTPAQVASIFTLGSDAANAAIAAALVPPTAFTWNGGGANNDWSTGLNWVGGTAPATSGTSLTFAGMTRLTPNLDANYSVNGLTISNNAGSFTIGTANSSTLTLAGDLNDNSTNAQTLTMPLTLNVTATVNSPTNLTLSDVVSGTGGITKTGNGVLTLSAANTISGLTTVAAGAVKLGDANSLQNSTVTINATNGVIFNAGIGTFNFGGLNGTNTTALTDTGLSPVTLSVGAGNAGSAFGGVLTGSGSLIKVGSGTLTLNGASTYTGGTTVSGGILAAQDAVAPGTVSPFGMGSVTVNNGAVLEVGYAPNNAFGSYSIANNVILDNGYLNAFDASHRVTGNLTIGAGGATVGSTFDAPGEVFAEANFPKALFFDGLVTGTGNLTVQQTGWSTGNYWNTSCSVFTSQGTAAQNTFSGTVTVNPLASPNGGSYLYLVGTNVFANATITLNGDNDAASGRMGVSSLLFGNGSVDGPGYATIGGLSGAGTLLLADTILFSGGLGYSTGIPVALTVGYNNSSTTFAGIMSGPGSLIKVGSGALTLAGANTYTGNTTINGGSLALTGGWLASSNITVAIGTTLDLSGLGSATLAGNQALLNGGTVTGTIYTSSGSKIYAGTDGVYGTNAITGDLTLASGAVAYFDVGATAAGVNDKVTVAGTLTASGNIIHLKAPSTLVNLDASADYVLFSSQNTIVGSFASGPAWDVAPANSGHYTIVTGTKTVTLHYASFSGPSGTGSATPSTALRNQNVLITVTAANGNPGTVNSVSVDASSIGGSATLALVAAGGNVWTNSVAATPDTSVGSKSLPATISDTASLSAVISIPLSVVVGNDVWNGAGADNNFSSNLNWTNKSAPGYLGDSLEFAGSARLTPNVDNNYTLTGIKFDSGAGAFNISSGNGSALTLTANGVVNNSASSQTLNVPVTMSVAQTFNAAAGNLTLAQGLAKAGNLVTVTGAANTVISSPISGSGSLFKQGSGSLTISTDATWDLAEATSGGLSGPLFDQAGTLTFNGGSTHAVNGELVIGGVITNGGAGNNARIVVDNATVNVSSWLSLGRGNGVGGVSSDLVLLNGGVVTATNLSAGFNAGNTNNLPKGTITMSDTSSLTVSGGSFYVGESSGSDMTMTVNGSATVSAAGATMVVGQNSSKGALNINGGSVSVGSLRIASGANNTSTSQGTVTVNSGTLSSEGDINIGFAGAVSDSGKLVINGGTVNIATTTIRWLIMGQWDFANSEIDVNGGNLHVNGNTSIRYAINGNTGTNTINLNSGAITFYSDNATTVGGSGVLDLHQGNGSTVHNNFNLNGGTLTVPAILSANTAGNRAFNFNGGTLKPTAANTSFLNLGTGGAANVRAGGAIIDTAGFDVTIPQALINNGVDQDGGLTKLGAGTLTLSGSNTYTNGTTVSAGTLALTQPVLSSAGAVTVASGAMLQLGFSGNDQVKALVLNGVSQVPGTYNATTSPSFISGTGNLVVPPPVNPNPPHLQVVISGSTLSLAWPTNAGWILQSNSVGLSASGSWYNYPADGSVGVTSVSVTMDPAKTNVFFRMVKP